MAIIPIIKEVKKIHPDDLILIQIGKFYQSYGRDSYILSYLFNYKLKNLGQNIWTTGFPKNAISKVLSKLEDKKINYIILDRRNNYEIIEKNDNKNLNKYKEIFEKSYEQTKLKIRINGIYSYLNNNIDKPQVKNKIYKIEKILAEVNESE